MHEKWISYRSHCPYLHSSNKNEPKNDHSVAILNNPSDDLRSDLLVLSQKNLLIREPTHQPPRPASLLHDLLNPLLVVSDLILADMGRRSHRVLVEVLDQLHRLHRHRGDVSHYVPSSRLPYSVDRIRDCPSAPASASCPQTGTAARAATSHHSLATHLDARQRARVVHSQIRRELVADHVRRPVLHHSLRDPLVQRLRRCPHHVAASDVAVRV